MTVNELKRASNELKAYERALKTVSSRCTLPAEPYNVIMNMERALAGKKEIAIRSILDESLWCEERIAKIKEIVNA